MTTTAFDQHRAKVMRAALTDATEFLLEEANRTVPHEEGTLEGSGTAGVKVQGDRMVGVVSYDTPYAVRQHEDTRLRHTGKGRAKWLERTANEQRTRIGKFLAERMAR